MATEQATQVRVSDGATEVRSDASTEYAKRAERFVSLALEPREPLDRTNRLAAAQVYATLANAVATSDLFDLLVDGLKVIPVE